MCSVLSVVVVLNVVISRCLFGNVVCVLIRLVYWLLLSCLGVV